AGVGAGSGVAEGLDASVTEALRKTLAEAPGEPLTAGRVFSDCPRAVFDAIAREIVRATQRPRVALKGLLPTSFQHPTDRAVLHGLMNVPVLGPVVTWFSNWFKRSGEVALLGQAFEVTEAGLPATYKAYRQAC